MYKNVKQNIGQYLLFANNIMTWIIIISVKFDLNFKLLNRIDFYFPFSYIKDSHYNHKILKQRRNNIIQNVKPKNNSTHIRSNDLL